MADANEPVQRLRPAGDGWWILEVYLAPDVVQRRRFEAATYEEAKRTATALRRQLLEAVFGLRGQADATTLRPESADSEP